MPIKPDSPEEWELELRTFAVANDKSLALHVRELVKDLWRELVEREPQG